MNESNDTARPDAPKGYHLCPCCHGQGFMPSGMTCQFCQASGVIEDAPAVPFTS